MKRILSVFLLLNLVFILLPLGAIATETGQTEPEACGVREPGMCGENLRWSYADGVLTVSGSGEMDGFEEGLAPWQAHKDSIRAVVLSGSVTSVGAYAFTDYDAIEAVEFGDALHTIGYRAFKSCDSLKRIVLPETFRKFDEECFMGCKSLGEIWCRGGMPSFKTSCIWDVSATIFYPPSKAWPAEYVIPLGDAFRWQIKFQAMDVPEEYLNTISVPAVTEPVQTEPAETEAAETEAAETEAVGTEPAETAPETTAAPTQAPTEATVAPETEPAPTQEETKPAWLAEMEQLEKQQEQEIPERKDGIGLGLVVGIAILSLILLLILIGALVFRRREY